MGSHLKTQLTEFPDLPVETLWRVIDALPARIYLKDRNGRFIFVNQACIKPWGLAKRSDAYRLTDADVYQPSLVAAARADEERIMATGEPMVDKFEFHPWSDGRDTWVLTTKMPLWGSEGKIIGVAGRSEDISPTKTAMERFERAADWLRDGMWHRDLRTNEIWFSPRWVEKNDLGPTIEKLPERVKYLSKRASAQPLIAVIRELIT